MDVLRPVREDAGVAGIWSRQKKKKKKKKRGGTKQRFVSDPAGTLAELVEQMRTFWDAALAPWWTRISALLESEIASRARRLVAVGA